MESHQPSLEPHFIAKTVPDALYDGKGHAGLVERFYYVGDMVKARPALIQGRPGKMLLIVNFIMGSVIWMQKVRRRRDEHDYIRKVLWQGDE